jgi:hypothetical protein
LSAVLARSSSSDLLAPICFVHYDNPTPVVAASSTRGRCCGQEQVGRSWYALV